MLWVALAAFGGFGGAALDQIHVQCGVLAYRHPWWWEQAWWVAPQFALGSVAVFRAAKGCVALIGRPAAGLAGRPASGRLAADAGWFVAAYGASGMLHGHGALLSTAYLSTWLARMAVRPDRRPVAAFSVLLALGGCWYEGTLAATGAFHYIHPDIYHVPSWLAGIYLHGGPMAVTLAGAMSGPPRSSAVAGDSA